MAECIEREKVLEIAKDEHYSDFHKSMADLTSLRELLEDTPAADVVEVVRCNDCRFYKPTEKHWGNVCVRQTAYKRPNDYCSKGERKEDNK